MRERFYVAGKGFSKKDFQDLLVGFPYHTFGVISKRKEQIYSSLLENDVYVQLVVGSCGEGLTISEVFLYGGDREDLDFVKKGLLRNLKFF